MQLETVDNEGNVGAVYRPLRRLPKKRLQERPLNRLLHTPRPSVRLRRPLGRHNSNNKHSRMCAMQTALKLARLERLRSIRGSPDTVASSIAITMAWPASNGFDIFGDSALVRAAVREHQVGDDAGGGSTGQCAGDDGKSLHRRAERRLACCGSL